MPVAESENLRSALLVVKEDLLEVLRLAEPSNSGDLIPLDILEMAYFRVEALIIKLESGNWAGRTVSKRLNGNADIGASEMSTASQPELQVARAS